MASYPCELCNARFPGRGSYLYPAVVNGASAHRERYRVCPTCKTNVLAGAEVRLSRVEDVGYTSPGFCWICETGTAEPMPAAFFLTAYVQDERQDWFGGVCAQCVSEGLDFPLLTP